jgi:hypothetical protein
VAVKLDVLAAIDQLADGDSMRPALGIAHDYTVSRDISPNAGLVCALALHPSPRPRAIAAVAVRTFIGTSLFDPANLVQVSPANAPTNCPFRLS